MAQVTVHNFVPAGENLSSSRTEVWYDATTVYSFFVGNSFRLAYRKSTDSGATWGSEVTLITAGVASEIGIIDFDVYYERWHNTANDPVVHVAGHRDTGTPRGYYYNRLNLATEVLLYADGYHLKDFNAEPFSGPLAIGVARNGDVHVVGRQGATEGTLHMVSTDDGVSWADSADIDFGQRQGDLIQLWPDASSADTADMLAYYVDVNNLILKVVQWDASAGLWLTPVNIGTSIGAHTGQLFTTYNNFNTAYRRSDGHVFVAAYPDVTSPNTLKFWDTFGTGSITARTNVLTAVANTNVVAVTVDKDGDLYVAYSRGVAGSAHVYYKISTDSGATWGSEVQYSSATGDVLWIQSDPSPNIDKYLPAYFWENEEDLYVEQAIPTNTGVVLAGQLTINFQLSGTLTGVTSAQPPVVVKCRPITVQKVITATLGTR